MSDFTKIALIVVTPHLVGVSFGFIQKEIPDASFIFCGR
jgi:hypothetical protein